VRRSTKLRRGPFPAGLSISCSFLRQPADGWADRSESLMEFGVVGFRSGPE
jgi:hypothetical protein